METIIHYTIRYLQFITVYRKLGNYMSLKKQWQYGEKSSKKMSTENFLQNRDKNPTWTWTQQQNYRNKYI